MKGSHVFVFKLQSFFFFPVKIYFSYFNCWLKTTIYSFYNSPKVVHPLTRSNKLPQISIFTAFLLSHHFNPTGPSFSTMSFCYAVTISFNLCSVMIMYTYICSYVYTYVCVCICMGLPRGVVVKNPPAGEGDVSLIPESRISPG